MTIETDRSVSMVPFVKDSFPSVKRIFLIFLSDKEPYPFFRLQCTRMYLCVVQNLFISLQGSSKTGMMTASMGIQIQVSLLKGVLFR
jgi:hypothetical protein